MITIPSRTCSLKPHSKPARGRSLAAVLSLLAMLCQAPGSATADELSKAQLASLFPGKFKATYHGRQVSVRALSGGRLKARSGDKTDTGKWRISSGGRLCISFTNWLSGRSVCGKVERNGSWYESGSIRFRRF